jgi:NTE family protein
MYKNLVFEGGGVKGAAYLGALQVIEDAGILTGIEKVAGTSAGAITACLVALKYTAAGIKTLVNDLDFNNLEDGKNLFRILETYGIYRGDYFLKWIKTAIKAATGNEDTTFAQLRAAGFKDLHVVATCLNTRGIQIFSADSTPDVIVAEAVRASMSIPIFFKAWTFSKGIESKNVYVDGGMVWNLPLEIFDTGNILNPETLGLCLWDYAGQAKSYPVPFGCIPDYIKTLFETLMTAQSDLISASTVNDFRLVKIDDFGISPTAFNISQADKDRLYQSGIDHTKKFLSK